MFLSLLSIAPLIPPLSQTSNYSQCRKPTQSQKSFGRPGQTNRHAILDRTRTGIAARKSVVQTKAGVEKFPSPPRKPNYSLGKRSLDRCYQTMLLERYRSSMTKNRQILSFEKKEKKKKKRKKRISNTCTQELQEDSWKVLYKIHIRYYF